MTARRGGAVLVLVAGALALVIPAGAAQSHSATIASFNYTPSDVKIAVGDTVVWTNVDPTVHTVTANRGEFSSGSMRQGQSFTARFNVPGVYPYFCEPHEFMRGTISVTGAAVQPTGTTSTTASLPAAAPTATVTSAPTGARTTTTIVARGNSAPVPVGPATNAVTTSGVTGGTHRTSPIAAVIVVTAFAALGLVVLLRARVARADAFRIAAAAATAGTGLVHLQLRLALDYPEPIGTLLVIEAAAAVILATWLIARPLTRRARTAAIAAHVGALAALAVTRTTIGLFGFHELGWDPSPQLPMALTIGVIAVALLVGSVQ